MVHGVDQIWPYFFLKKAALEDKKIDVYNYGEMSRDFTYIDDIVDALIKP